MGPERTTQASRITDSVKTTQKETNKRRSKPKKEAVKAATKVNPEAEYTNETAKSLTRSKSKTIATEAQENQAQQ